MSSIRRPSLLAFAVLTVALAGCARDPAVAGARRSLTANDYDRALDLLNTELASDPDNVPALVLKTEVLRLQSARAPTPAARAAVLAEMNATARRAYALESGDDDVQDARTNAWAATMDYAETIRRDPSTRPGVAVALFADAVSLLPDSARGHLSLGTARFAAGDATAAIEPLRTAARLDPGDDRAALYLGRVLLEADEGTEAISVLETAADRFPNAPDIVDLLFAAYERTGRGADALARYQRQLAAATPATEAALRLGYGTALIQADRPDEAAREIERATELAPDDADAHYNLGAALQRAAAALNAQADAATDRAESDRLIAERDGYLGRALTALLRARDLSAEGPDRQDVCTALFQVYTQLERVDDAVEVAECAGVSMN